MHGDEMRKILPIFIAFAIAMSAIQINAGTNNPPTKPVINGPTEGEAGTTYTYTVVSTDPDGDKIRYCFDWGDGETFCSDYMNSGQTFEAYHSWAEKGTYVIKVYAEDENKAKSETATLQVKMPLAILGYTGKLKIYVVEPVSRWNNYDGEPYGFGFLDFAYDGSLNIEYMETSQVEVEWDPAEAGYSGVSEDNIMAIAAVFNPVPQEGHAYPPFRNPFDAYYVDACAAARPGEKGVNERGDNVTHTVLIETGTATWCPYCPIMDRSFSAISPIA